MKKKIDALYAELLSMQLVDRNKGRMGVVELSTAKNIFWKLESIMSAPINKKKIHY